jgi:hypothetical protein
MQGYTASQTRGAQSALFLCATDQQSDSAYREMICTTKADSLKNNANNFIKINLDGSHAAGALEGRVSNLGTSSAEWFALDETSRKADCSVADGCQWRATCGLPKPASCWHPQVQGRKKIGRVTARTSAIRHVAESPITVASGEPLVDLFHLLLVGILFCEQLGRHDDLC